MRIIATTLFLICEMATGIVSPSVPTTASTSSSSAEVHIIGSLVGASGFPSSTLCCVWQIVAGDQWMCVEGDVAGQTHVDVPLDTRMTVWNHPIDVHYATTSVSGWPRLRVKVYRQDMFGRNELYGYGFAHVPSSPGHHAIDIVTWRPTGTAMDKLWSYYLGATPQLKDMDLVDTPADRYRLTTMSMGTVHVDVSVMLRNFVGSGVNV